MATKDAIDPILVALADPTRRGIVSRLAQGTATVSELVGCFDLSQPTISSHLKVLERAGLISRRRVARTRPCKLEPQALRILGNWLGKLRASGQQHEAGLEVSLPPCTSRLS